MRRLVLITATLAALAVAQVALPCHIPTYLRQGETNLTSEDVAHLAHGAPPVHIAYALAATAPCSKGMADIFPCRNVTLLEFLPLDSIGGGTGSDIWGWTDALTGKEYALIGRSNGTAFVDITDPQNPVYVGNLPTQTTSSSWRDIKVYADHAFIVADFAGAHGLQVFDLHRLRGLSGPATTFSPDAHYAGFNRAHNVVINEDTGFAYAVGSDTCAGGLHMIDIHNPLQPTFAGCFSSDGYTHDAQCVVYHGPDVEHAGKEICFNANEDTLTIVDVTNKSNPVQLSRTSYQGASYTHQGWLTEDQARFVHDDEGDEFTFGHNTRTYVWDLADLDHPVVATTFTAEGKSVDHNQYVRNGYIYQANYRRGLRILKLGKGVGDGLQEVAYFDSYPEMDGNGYQGAWSVYPFFASGTIVLSDINRGLFILRAQLPGSIFADGFERGDTTAWTAIQRISTAPTAAEPPATPAPPDSP